MTNAHDILMELRSTHAFSAYSGARKAHDLIQRGKKHLLYFLYHQVCGYGDWERARGIDEIVKSYGYEEELRQPKPTLYKEATHTLGEAWVADDSTISPVKESVLFYEVTEGRYQIIAFCDTLEEGTYSFAVEDRMGQSVEVEWGIASGKEGFFTVNEWEEGIINVSIIADSGLLTSCVVFKD